MPEKKNWPPENCSGAVVGHSRRRVGAHTLYFFENFIPTASSSSPLLKSEITFYKN
jgi:hypothetical protein